MSARWAARCAPGRMRRRQTTQNAMRHHPMSAERKHDVLVDHRRGNNAPSKNNFWCAKKSKKGGVNPGTCDSGSGDPGRIFFPTNCRRGVSPVSNRRGESTIPDRIGSAVSWHMILISFIRANRSRAPGGHRGVVAYPPPPDPCRLTLAAGRAPSYLWCLA